jgi:hypothetical protein
MLLSIALLISNNASHILSFSKICSAGIFSPTNAVWLTSVGDPPQLWHGEDFHSQRETLCETTKLLHSLILCSKPQTPSYVNLLLALRGACQRREARRKGGAIWVST